MLKKNLFLASGCWNVAFHTCFVHDNLHHALVKEFAAVLQIMWLARDQSSVPTLSAAPSYAGGEGRYRTGKVRPLRGCMRARI